MKKFYVVMIILSFITAIFGAPIPKNDLVVSSSFNHNTFMAETHAYGGDNKSPALKLENLHPKAVSIAVICEDPDAPGSSFFHWLAWNIPPVSVIPEGLSKSKNVSEPFEFNQGMNDFGFTGYDGPWPPENHGVHRYFFKVYVLDTKLNITSKNVFTDDLLKSMKGHVLQEGSIVGLFERKY